MPKTSLRKSFIQLRNELPASQAKIAAINAADNFIKNIKLNKVKTIAFYHPIRGEIDPLPLLDKILAITHTPFSTRIWLFLKGKKLLTPLPKTLSLRKKSIIFSLPTVQSASDPLLFHPWQPGDKLIKNAIYPQLSEAEIQKEHIIPDIILVPLVAFDEHCHRLGYGAGFYDKTIRNIREQGNKGVRAKGIREKGNKKVFLTILSYLIPYSLKPLTPLIIGYAYECQKSPTTLPTDPHDMQLDYIVTDKALYSSH